MFIMFQNLFLELLPNYVEGIIEKEKYYSGWLEWIEKTDDLTFLGLSFSLLIASVTYELQKTYKAL